MKAAVSNWILTGEILRAGEVLIEIRKRFYREAKRERASKFNVGFRPPANLRFFRASSRRAALKHLQIENLFS